MIEIPKSKPLNIALDLLVSRIKKETVRGIIGYTHGVRRAPNPARKAIKNKLNDNDKIPPINIIENTNCSL